MERGDYFLATRHRLLCPWPGGGGWVRWPIRLRAFARKLVRVVASVSQRLWPKSLIIFDYKKTREYRIDRPEWLARVRQPWTFLDEWINLVELEIPLLPEIFTFFTPAADLQEVVTRHLAPVRQETDLLIGVHWRRGDYRQYMGGRYYYPAPVYRRVMERVQHFFPGKRVTFLVCSNEPIDPADFAPLRIVTGPGTEPTDLFALAECDYLLGAPSTYSLWAAFYARKPLWFITHAEAEPASLTDFHLPGPTFNQFGLTWI